MADKKRKFDESKVTRDESGRFASGGSTKRVSLKEGMRINEQRSKSRSKAKPAAKSSTLAKKRSSKPVTNKGLLSRQERLQLNPNSRLQGAAIKAIPGESPADLKKRAREAAKKLRRQNNTYRTTPPIIGFNTGY